MDSSDRFEETACILFIESCAVPVFDMSDGKQWIVGTGSLLRTGSRICWVTARHVLDYLGTEVGYDSAMIPLPDRPRETSEVAVAGLGRFETSTCPNINFGSLRPARSRIDCEDLAAVVIESARTVEKLTASYSYLTPEQFLQSDEKASFYCVGGYPQGARVRLDGGYGWRFYHFRTEAREDTGGVNWDPPADPAVDFFLAPPRNICNQHGQEVRQPDLRGLSGSLVWAVLDKTGAAGLWTAQKQMRVAGIQKACSDRSRTIRATNAAAVRRLLEAIKSKLS